MRYCGSTMQSLIVVSTFYIRFTSVKINHFLVIIANEVSFKGTHKNVKKKKKKIMIITIIIKLRFMSLGHSTV